MGDERRRIEEQLAALKRERDELALKIHLAKAEARTEWKDLETRLDELEKRARPLAQALGDTASGVGASLELAADEIKKGFEKIRKLL
jgi:chromosome segregation ATPase